jgi:acylaminoacyl-peptidase
MRPFRRLAALAVAPLLLLLAGPAAARPFTPKDLVTLDRVGDPKLSPDGRWVAYNLRVVDYEANKARQEIWLASTDGRSPARRIAGAAQSATSPRWAPDGSSVYFITGQSGSDQVWRVRPDGSDARQVTNLPLDVGSFKLSPDGRRLVVSVSVFPDCPTLQCTKDRQAAKAQGSGRLYDRIFVRHWDTWADGTNNHLWALTLGANGAASGDAVPLMRGFDGDAPSKPFGDDTDYAISPDGRTVVFSARVAGKTEPWSTNFDLYRVGIDGQGRPRNLTRANPAWDAGPVFSPDGRWLAYRAMKRPGFEADRFGVMLMDLRGGAVRELAPGWDRSAENLTWSAGGRSLLTTAQDVGQLRVFEIGVPPPGAPGTAATVAPLTGQGHVSALDAAGGRIVYASDNFKSPAQLFVLGGGRGPVQVTNHNAQKLAGVDFADAEQFSFQGWSGETVYGHVMKPVNFRPGRKYPVAFLIHGGPQGSYGNLFHYRWNYQTYAAKGYAVVFIDFHGSTGYGQAFTDAISGHWGDRPLEDLQKGWAYALGKYGFLDGRRACALGASYGGYMVNWIAGVWNEPWRCLVNHDGVFDNRMMGYSTEELWFSEWENQGTPFERPENYEKFNPVNHVAQWSKPMLVIHGEKDFRIPVEQGLGTFGALQRRGIESRLLVFPDENHWVLKPQNSVQWHTTVEDWLDRWIGDGRRG